MAKRLQNFIFVLAFNDWLQTNFKRQLTEEEFNALTSQFEVKDNFKKIEIKCKNGWQTCCRILDQFISCDIVNGISNSLAYAMLSDIIVVGFKPEDVKLPIKTVPHAPERKYLDSAEDNVWHRLLIGTDFEALQDKINIQAQEELDVYAKFIKKLGNDIDKDVNASNNVEDVEDKYEPILDKYFNDGTAYITPSEIDWDIQCKFTFKNYNEALKCINFAQSIVSNEIDINGIKWFTEYLGSYRIIDAEALLLKTEDDCLERKFPGYERNRWLFRPHKPATTTVAAN